jgi:hypothetical protein
MAAAIARGHLTDRVEEHLRWRTVEPRLDGFLPVTVLRSACLEVVGNDGASVFEA